MPSVRRAFLCLLLLVQCLQWSMAAGFPVQGAAGALGQGPAHAFVAAAVAAPAVHSDCLPTPAQASRAEPPCCEPEQAADGMACGLSPLCSPAMALAAGDCGPELAGVADPARAGLAVLRIRFQTGAPERPPRG